MAFCPAVSQSNQMLGVVTDQVLHPWFNRITLDSLPINWILKAIEVMYTLSILALPCNRGGHNHE